MLIRFFSILLFFVFLTTVGLYAQIQFVDRLNSEPIAAMSIFNSDGLLIGTTDMEGQINWVDTETPAHFYNNYIVTDHIAYEPNRFFVNNLDSTQVYRMTPIMKNISEVIIQRPSLSNQAVLKLTCYYRSFDNYDRENRYYFDGIIDCYIPLSGIKPRYELLDYRIFLNDSVHDNFTKATGNFLSFSFLPEISVKRIAERLREFTVDEGKTYRYIRKKDAIVGRLKEHETQLEVYRDKVRPDSVLIHKLFGFELHVLEEKVYEIYGAKPELEKINVYDLERISETIVSKIKRGKMALTPYEMSTQLYVIHREVMSQKAYKAIQNKLVKHIRRLPEASLFKEKYWENLSVHGIPDVSQKVPLGGKMKLITR